MAMVITHDVLTVTRYSHGGVDNQTIVRGVTSVAPRKAKVTQVVV